MISGYWDHPAVIAVTDFKFKSLSDFTCNTAVGCGHGCGFCYVSSVSTIKQKGPLALLGVHDPDAEWGAYVFPRHWDEEAFLKSLRSAENLAENKLKPEGHKAVMFCSTTDPYQTIKNPDKQKGRDLTAHHQAMVRRALKLIRDHSTLNVRILTRSPLAKQDFDLFKSFGNRLLFGMSLPTLDNKLARIFEPSAPSPSKRLETLRAAKDAGVNIYVAVAPTYADCNDDDIRATLTAVAGLDPVTVFHEPINIRAENVERIRQHAQTIGAKVNLDPFATDEAWQKYALGQLQAVERIAGEIGILPRLHLWPDQSMGKRSVLENLADPTARVHWLTKWWTRISEWPE